MRINLRNIDIKDQIMLDHVLAALHIIDLKCGAATVFTFDALQKDKTYIPNTVQGKTRTKRKRLSGISPSVPVKLKLARPDQVRGPLVERASDLRHNRYVFQLPPSVKEYKKTGWAIRHRKFVPISTEPVALQRRFDRFHLKLGDVVKAFNDLREEHDQTKDEVHTLVAMSEVMERKYSVLSSKYEALVEDAQYIVNEVAESAQDVSFKDDNHRYLPDFAIACMETLHLSSYRKTPKHFKCIFGGAYDVLLSCPWYLAELFRDGSHSLFYASC